MGKILNLAVCQCIEKCSFELALVHHEHGLVGVYIMELDRKNEQERVLNIAGIVIPWWQLLGLLFQTMIFGKKLLLRDIVTGFSGKERRKQEVH